MTIDVKPCSGQWQHNESRAQTQCYHIVLRNGDSLRFTSHDAPIDLLESNDREVDPTLQTYLPKDAPEMGSRSFVAGLELAEASIFGHLGEDGEPTDFEAFRAGMFKNARLDVYDCNWHYAYRGWIRASRYYFDDVEFSAESWSATVGSPLRHAMRTVGGFITRYCDVEEWGDARCTINRQLWKVQTTVTDVTGTTKYDPRKRFRVNIGTTVPIPGGTRALTSGWFSEGDVDFESGANSIPNQKRYRIQRGQFIDPELEILLENQVPFDIQVGDTVDLFPGCNRHFHNHCRKKFSIEGQATELQYENFRGFNHIEGAYKTYRGPEAQD
jgi:uncharacterized phage protein (TIGR02218 family)